MPDVTVDPDCVTDANKVLDEAELDGPERMVAVELPVDFIKLSPASFDGVDDGEGLES